jgi:hypothetical protein
MLSPACVRVVGPWIRENSAGAPCSAWLVRCGPRRFNGGRTVGGVAGLVGEGAEVVRLGDGLVAVGPGLGLWDALGLGDGLADGLTVGLGDGLATVGLGDGLGDGDGHAPSPEPVGDGDAVGPVHGHQWWRRCRRVARLRREQAALLAGVGSDYLRQARGGRAAGASESVLEGIARARQLDEAERAYPFDLARAATPAPPRALRRPAASIRSPPRCASSSDRRPCGQPSPSSRTVSPTSRHRRRWPPRRTSRRANNRNPVCD